MPDFRPENALCSLSCLLGVLVIALAFLDFSEISVIITVGIIAEKNNTGEISRQDLHDYDDATASSSSTRSRP